MIKAYARLVMFSHTLFSIPFGIIAMLMAADGFPSLWLTVWILVAADQRVDGGQRAEPQRRQGYRRKEPADSVAAHAAGRVVRRPAG
jgi:4-hydroxybenzoate polyprenyltransferase